MTEHFCETRLLGEGGFAKVFLGSAYLDSTAPEHLPGEMVVKVDKYVYESTSIPASDGQKVAKVKTPYMQKADKVRYLRTLSIRLMDLQKTGGIAVLCIFLPPESLSAPRFLRRRPEPMSGLRILCRGLGERAVARHEDGQRCWSAISNA